MNVLIINIGPFGDVLRTTVLLNVFKNDNIYWLTSVKNIEILNSKSITELFFIENISKNYFKIKYDLIISLNEEYPFRFDVKFDQLIGVYNEKQYTNDSSAWFDMSLISKYGIEKSNILKKNNRKSYNQILIEMINEKWTEQDYVFDYNNNIKNNLRIGLIDTVEGIWKSKRWDKFQELYNLLKNDFKVDFLNMKTNLTEHINDINNCNIIICPDTFGMHAALAMKKNVIALFNSTSPHEIYNYNNKLVKVINPLYDKFFYTKEYNYELSNSIETDLIYKEFLKLIQK